MVSPVVAAANRSSGPECFSTRSARIPFCDRSRTAVSNSTSETRQAKSYERSRPLSPDGSAANPAINANVNRRRTWLQHQACRVSTNAAQPESRSGDPDTRTRRGSLYRVNEPDIDKSTAGYESAIRARDMRHPYALQQRTFATEREQVQLPRSTSASQQPVPRSRRETIALSEQDVARRVVNERISAQPKGYEISTVPTKNEYESRRRTERSLPSLDSANRNVMECELGVDSSGACSERPTYRQKSLSPTSCSTQQLRVARNGSPREESYVCRSPSVSETVESGNSKSNVKVNPSEPIPSSEMLDSARKINYIRQYEFAKLSKSEAPINQVEDYPVYLGFLIELRQNNGSFALEDGLRRQVIKAVKYLHAQRFTQVCQYILQHESITSEDERKRVLDTIIVVLYLMTECVKYEAALEILIPDAREWLARFGVDQNMFNRIVACVAVRSGTPAETARVLPRYTAPASAIVRRKPVAANHLSASNVCRNQNDSTLEGEKSNAVSPVSVRSESSPRRDEPPPYRKQFQIYN